MRYFVFLSILLVSLTGCDVQANKVSGESQGVNLDLSKIDNVVTSKDNNEKIKYFNALLVKAENNDPVAQNLVGVVFENGYFNQEKDVKKAIYWYNKAIDNNNGLAENNMGSLYAHGNGVKQDYKKAYEYYESAMKKNIPESINSIGFMYFNGFYFRQDYKKACEYYKKSADLGYYPAQSNLANCYSNGWNGPVNQDKFFEYSLKAAQQGSIPSQFNVAAAFQRGIGVDKSIPDAIVWYKRALDGNDSRAAFNLGVIYENGNGVEQDINLAYAYFYLAKELDLDIAQEKLDKLTTKVNKENIRILKNDGSIQIAVDQPDGEWKVYDEEEVGGLENLQKKK